MDIRPLASFAINARLKLIQSSKARIEQVLIENSQERLEKPLVVDRLERELKAKGLEEVVSEVSYIWFNRFLALTMLDAIGFNNPAVLTPTPGSIYPEILQEAKVGHLDRTGMSADSASRIQGILSGQIPSSNSDAEIYALLLQAVCKSWGDRFPMVFQANYEVAEMLAPTDLLSRDSVRSDFIRVIIGDYAKDVETIGWLFQFYNSEVKDSAYKKFRLGKKASHQDLVAATQIFTPRFIADSMVENTIGSLWVRKNSNSSLAGELPAVSKLEGELEGALIPEEITVLDPAVGSGNLLLSAYNYLERIYLEGGHNVAAIPRMILEHNLNGIDIDSRAASLASFALWLRASKGIGKTLALDLPQPKITVLEDEPLLFDAANECTETAMRKRIQTMASAGTLGALVKVRDQDIEFLEGYSNKHQIRSHLIDRAIRNLLPLSKEYLVVIANPPYMGPKNMPPLLRGEIAENFTEGKADLYGAFLIRAFELLSNSGRMGLITQVTWLNIQRFESLRRWFHRFARDGSLIRVDANAFSGVAGFVGKVLTFAGPSGSRLTRELGLSPNKTKYNSVDLGRFDLIPNMPFALGLPIHLLDAFSSAPNVGSLVKTNNGTSTGENEVFFKLWWEVNPESIERTSTSSESAAESSKKWFPSTKGGPPLKWFGNMLHVINWQNDGKDLRTGLKADGSHRNFQLMSRDMAFRPYVCWSDIGQTSAFRYTPSGFMSAKNSPAFSASEPFGLIAFLNSEVVSALLDSLNPTWHVQIREVECLPILVNLSELSELGESAVSLAEKKWDLQELSLNFDSDFHIAMLASGAKHYCSSLEGLVSDLDSRLSDIQRRVDEIVAEPYGFPWGAPELGENTDHSLEFFEQGDEELDQLEKDGRVDAAPINPALFQAMSIVVGILFGRHKVEGKIGNLLDEDNIIPMLSQGYFEDDFSLRLAQFFDQVAPTEALSSLRWIESQLGQSISQFMRKNFFDYHSMSFHKKPVYWVIKSPKGSFQALTYIHRFTVDTLANCRSKYVQPLIDKLRTQQRAIQSSDAKKAAALQIQIDDLEELDNRLYELVLNPPAIDFDEGVAKNHERFASVMQKIK